MISRKRLNKRCQLAISVVKSVGESLQKYFKTVPTTEKIALTVFLFTSVHAAFLQPYFVIIPGERAKIFSGLLCAMSLFCAVLMVGKLRRFGTARELGISIALLLLVLVSSALSSIPVSSSYRGFVVLASGLGGFWCARILLTDSFRLELFKWFCLCLLVALAAAGVIGYFVRGSVHAFLDVNPHPLANRMLLLSFAPVALIIRKRNYQVILGILVLCACYVVFYLSDLRSAMIIPVILVVLTVFFGFLKLRHCIVLLVVFALILTFFFHSLPPDKIGLTYEPAYYRAENYPFSWHIASKHPFFGIGLRAPRDEYLHDYQIKYPYVTKEKFAESVKTIVSSENIFLTFAVEVGFPFVVLYTFSLSTLIYKLASIVKDKKRQYILPPLALLLSITAGLLHFQVLDGLLHPQISWFFHILLGLIPVSPTLAAESSADNLKRS